MLDMLLDPVRLCISVTGILGQVLMASQIDMSCGLSF